MKTSNAKTKAYAFRGGAALITATVLALVALFGMTGCPNNAGGSGSGGGNTGGGGTPTPVYTQVPYGTNGADLQAWLQNNAAAAPAVNYIELTGVTRDHLSGSVGNPSPLGKIIQDSGKKVALKLPETVDQIGGRAFYKCTALTGIDLSACTHLWAGAKIYGYAFAKCTELKTVTFGGARFLEIEQFAFEGCTALSSADMSGCPSLEKIDMWAFQDCTALKELRVPKSLTTIGTDAFKNCSSIETLAINCPIKDSIITNLTQKADSAKTLTLGEGVTVIGANAFNFYFLLEEADLSACTTLIRIETNAFFACSQATVKLPESITMIASGSHAFGDSADLNESCCKKVLIKSGAEYDRIKSLVTGSGYPADRIEAYN